MYRMFFKRVFDLIFSFSALFILSPVLLIVAFFVRIKLGSPVIFKQDRPGHNEVLFTLYKFRTMTEERNEQGQRLDDDQRLTTFGRKLRAWSLDELPELYNVLRGDMSLVGPRPLLAEYLPLYNDEQRRRHAVKPGLTGLAQVSGRNAISWHEKFSLDIRYVEEISFLLDVRIIGKTLVKLITREGINSSATVTMDVFRGNM